MNFEFWIPELDLSFELKNYILNFVFPIFEIMAKRPWVKAMELRPAVQKENFCPWFQIRICSEINLTLYWPKSNLESFWSFFRSGLSLMRTRTCWEGHWCLCWTGVPIAKTPIQKYKYRYRSVREDEFRVRSVIEGLTVERAPLWKLQCNSQFTHTVHEYKGQCNSTSATAGKLCKL